MKNIRVVFSLIIAMVVLVFSTVCFAGSGNSREAVTTDEGHVLEEGGDGSEIVILQCGSDTTYNQQEIREGAPNIQYSVRTIGMRESEVDLSNDEIVQEEHIIKTDWGEIDGKRRMKMLGGSELRVNIMVYCSNGDSKNISLTNSSFQCERGNGTRVKVFRPGSTVVTKFYVVLELTKIIYDDPVEEQVEPEKPESAMLEEHLRVLAALENDSVRQEIIRLVAANQDGGAKTSAERALRLNQAEQRLLEFEIQTLEGGQARMRNRIAENERRVQEINLLLRPNQIVGPPQPTPINPSGLGSLGTSFSGRG